jgi:recombination protein RecT
MAGNDGQVVGQKDLAKSVAVVLQGYSRNVEQSLPPAALAMISPDRAIRLIMNECRRIPALLDCSPHSIVGAMLTSAALGLEIGSHLGHGYILPFKGVATFVPGYKGLIALAYRSQQIRSLASHVVYERDEFAVELGSEPRIHHSPMLDGERGNPRLYYAIAQLTTGGVVFDRPLTIGDVRKIKAASPGARKSGGPWDTHPDEMARKSAIRRLVKYLPASTELQQAAAIDEAVDQNRRPEMPPNLDWLANAQGMGNAGEPLDAEIIEGDAERGKSQE